MSKVLIVDDAYFMRNLIKKALREAGHEVVGEAKNGTEGLQMFKELKPDLVTMDIKMPDISGIEVTRQILSEFPKAKIIAVTGNNDESIKKEMLKAGAMDYLRKPFQPAFLLTKIEGMLQEESEPVSLVESTSDDQVSFHLEDKQEEVLDDFFENTEVELQDKPDETKARVLVIENEEDFIEFPQEYPVEEEEEKHSLTIERVIELEEETDSVELIASEINVEKEVLVLSPAEPSEPIAHASKEQVTEPTAHTWKEQVTSFEPESVRFTPLSLDDEEVPLKEHLEPSLNIPSFESREIDSPIRIRPPRSKAFSQEEQHDQEDDMDVEDFILDTSSENMTMTAEKKKGVFGFVKKLFKSN